MHGYLLVKEYLISKGFKLTTPSNIKRTVILPVYWINELYALHLMCVKGCTNSLLHLRERLI